MSQSAERKAANESAFRNLNESIEATREELALTEGRTPYLCECDDPRCTQTVRLAMGEYESVRTHPRQFVVAPDHDPAAAIVLKGEGFTIVEKTGEEGHLVEQQDPRNQAN